MTAVIHFWLGRRCLVEGDSQESQIENVNRITKRKIVPRYTFEGWWGLHSVVPNDGADRATG